MSRQERAIKGIPIEWIVERVHYELGAWFQDDLKERMFSMTMPELDQLLVIVRGISNRKDAKFAVVSAVVDSEHRRMSA